MCTMSVIRTPDDSLRIAFNRDELKTRPDGVPPRIERFGDCKAILPHDSQSHGTWIAANDAGLVLGLLNVSPSRGIGGRSRGAIIPMLLSKILAAEAIDEASSMPLHEFSAFRLIAIDRHEVGQLRYDGRRARFSISPLDRPLMFTSSGLGDHLVQHPRQKLFHGMLAEHPRPAAQDAFHRHRWPDQPHLSVNMSRADARTVSITIIEVRGSGMTMAYTDSVGHVTRVHLPSPEAVAA